MNCRIRDTNRVAANCSSISLAEGNGSDADAVKGTKNAQRHRQLSCHGKYALVKHPAERQMTRKAGVFVLRAKLHAQRSRWASTPPYASNATLQVLLLPSAKVILSSFCVQNLIMA
jgi:hypothetical protein